MIHGLGAIRLELFWKLQGLKAYMVPFKNVWAIYSCVAYVAKPYQNVSYQSCHCRYRHDNQIHNSKHRMKLEIVHVFQSQNFNLAHICVIWPGWPIAMWPLGIPEHLQNIHVCWRPWSTWMQNCAQGVVRFIVRPCHWSINYQRGNCTAAPSGSYVTSYLSK